MIAFLAGLRRYSGIILVGLVVSAGSTGVVLGQVKPGAKTLGASWEATGAYTPAPGSAERKAIMDALRGILGVEDVVFVVRFLKVSGGWAWVETDPRSKDGRNRYEPVDCLLRKRQDTWTVLRCRPCCAECDDDPDCREPARYYKKLRSSFPGAPASIFPK